MARNRWAMLTVDTEALPKRATDDHVKRLIWGEHEAGTAGVRELCSAGNDVGAKHIFFVDFCGAYARKEEIAGVVSWLVRDGQDGQLHVHPEYLPAGFWLKHGFPERPRYLNQFCFDKAEFAIKFFGKMISEITGKPVLGFRAGSFRWNADTLRALATAGVKVSFNNSMHASIAGQCVYSEPTNAPYLWSNGVIEVPMTERQFYPRIRKGLWAMTDFLVKHFNIRERFPDFGEEWWRRLQFPASYSSFPTHIVGPYKSNSLLVMLMHSWSLLYWDENGYGTYRDDKRADSYRKLIRWMSKNYDIITTEEFLDLHSHGKIKTTHAVDIEKAEMK